MTRQKQARPGVTLIEILVVLAIIAVLLALTGAALQKTSETQKVKTSETQVFKLQQSLELEYERVVAKCAQDVTNKNIPPQIVVACDGNEARAKAVYTAFQLRLNFPETFAEANLTPLTIVDASGAAVYQIQRPATFASIAGLTGDATRPEDESGVLLYLVLAKRSVSGGGAMAVGAEDLTQASRRKVTFGGREFETFSDALQRSVGFKRWEETRNATVPLPVAAQNTNEAQRQPFVDASKSIDVAPNANRDPLDPQNLVLGWNLGANDPRRSILTGLIRLPGPAPVDVQTGLYFRGQNRMPSVYSLGRTKLDRNNNPTPEDDILGFRLRKQGEKGYKQ